MHRCLPLAVVMLTLPLTAEEQADAPSAAVETADFSEGLRRLAALGLPEMKGAVWVRKPADGPSGIEESYQFRELGVRPRGGSWKLPGEPVRLLAFGSTETSEWTPPAKEEPSGEPGLLGKMLRNHAASKPAAADKDPLPAADLDDDVARLAEALGKDKIRENLRRMMEYNMSGEPGLPGSLLIFAAVILFGDKLFGY